MTKEELKARREELALTQQQLAEKAGWTGKNAKQRVYDYEKGRKAMTPAIQTLFKLLLLGK